MKLKLKKSLFILDFILVFLLSFGSHAAMGFKISSTAFTDQSDIPSLYTCQGKNISPPLAWYDTPEDTQSFVLIIGDPDAPDPADPKMIWYHWVLYNIPAEVTSLPEAIAPSQLPRGTLEGLTSWKTTPYGGPCPPIGQHRYFFTLYALDRKLPDLNNPTTEVLYQLMADHIVAKTELVGLYQKH